MDDLKLENQIMKNNFNSVSKSSGDSKVLEE